jgi:protein-disulfide isomerase
LSAQGVSRERRRRLLQLGSAAAFLAIVVVAILIVVSQTQTSGGDADLEGERIVRRQLEGIPQRGMVLGDPAAAVTLVEFGDLQCPACKAYAEEIIPEVIESKIRSGEARLDFRNYTIIGQDSMTAATAALAAAAQNRGWSFVELFYRNQGFENSGYTSDAFMTSIAKAAGVADIDRWNEDRHSGRLAQRVSRESAEAEGLGFGSTPSFAVDGPGAGGLEPLDLPGSAAEIEAAIEDAG